MLKKKKEKKVANCHAATNVNPFEVPTASLYYSMYAWEYNDACKRTIRVATITAICFDFFLVYGVGVARKPLR
jgi:hypothetical protein